MKGEGSGTTLYYLLVFQVVMFLLFGAFSTSMAEINCPSLSTSPTGNPFNESNQNVTQANYFSWLTVLTGSCSGLPYWVWFIVFLPSILAIILIVLPNWLSGA